MSKKTKTGAKVAAGRAEPRLQIPQRTPWMENLRPLQVRGLSAAQIAAKVQMAQGLPVQSLFTVRNDATFDDALDTVNSLLTQCCGVLSTMVLDGTVHNQTKATASAVETLILQAMAALVVVEEVLSFGEPAPKVEP